MRLCVLDPSRLDPFPAVDTALEYPNGLLAAGGDLSVDRLLMAYRRGIFPWFSEGEPILWWSPDPRMVFGTDQLHVSRRLARWLRACTWTVRADTAFGEVMRACARPRPNQPTTWISEAMIDAYGRLHEAGYAHSLEVYAGDDMVGGIYGVAIGQMFFGESMFSAVSGGSKVALLALCHVLREWGWPLLDAQVESDHLQTLGAQSVPRRDFIVAIDELATRPDRIGNWRDQLPVFDIPALAPR